MPFFKNLLRWSGGYKNEITTIKDWTHREDLPGTSTLFLIPAKTYPENLIFLCRIASEKHGKLLYVSINKPAFKIIGEFNENRINPENFLFIDAVGNEHKPQAKGPNISYISPINDFKNFCSDLMNLVEEGGYNCLMFDSLSTLLAYSDQNILIKFFRGLIARLEYLKKCSGFLCLLEDADTPLIENFSMIVDRIIDLGKSEIPESVSSKKELSAKLMNELKSIKQAYMAGLLSEETYIKSRERLDKKINKAG